MSPIDSLILRRGGYFVISVVELFAGVGGFRLGFDEANVKLGKIDSM